MSSICLAPPLSVQLPHKYRARDADFVLSLGRPASSRDLFLPAETPNWTFYPLVTHRAVDVVYAL